MTKAEVYITCRGTFYYNPDDSFTYLKIREGKSKQIFLRCSEHR